jgi:hypothetical protein
MPGCLPYEKVPNWSIVHNILCVENLRVMPPRNREPQLNAVLLPVEPMVVGWMVLSLCVV